MAVALTPDDLRPFAPDLDSARADAMIADATATAYLLAPCLARDDVPDVVAAAARAIVRGAILRWLESGAGGLTTDQQTAGPFTSTRTTSRTSMFWKSEEQKLRSLCGGGKAFALDTMPERDGDGPDWWAMSERHTMPVSVLREQPDWVWL